MAEPDDDRALVTAAQRDRRQFTALYERNVDAVHAYVYRRVDNRADAEDITSLVFQKALANLDRFEWRGLSHYKPQHTEWCGTVAAGPKEFRFVCGPQ